MMCRWEWHIFHKLIHMSMCISCVHTYTYYQYTCTLLDSVLSPVFFVLLMALKFRIHVQADVCFSRWEFTDKDTVTSTWQCRRYLGLVDLYKYHKPGIWNFKAPYFERLPFKGIPDHPGFKGFIISMDWLNGFPCRYAIGKPCLLKPC